MSTYRKRRLCFRLTFDEEQKYLPLLRDYYTPDWSRLIRKALADYWKSKLTSVSDIGSPRLTETIGDLVAAPIGASSSAAPTKPDKAERQTRPAKSDKAERQPKTKRVKGGKRVA